MSIKTEILKNDWGKAVKSIIDEVKRGGQIYFIHNEVQTINSIKTKLEFLAPGVKFAIAHGQMSGSELDRVMSEF